MAITERRPEALVDVFEAFRALVHEAGVPALAARMGMPPGVLYNKANPNESTHHTPTLRDVVLVSTLTQDHRVLHALAHTLDHVAIPVPDLVHVADDALLDLVAKTHDEQGQFFALMRLALGDGAVTQGELRHLRRESMEWIAAIVELVARLEGLVGE
ncbi:MAG: phage regulatory CII family protein [Burkholderiales bacterium]|nr:phage regulatory CII family protein [Burkholderiales bacterium]